MMVSLLDGTIQSRLPIQNNKGNNIEFYNSGDEADNCSGNYRQKTLNVD